MVIREQLKNLPGLQPHPYLIVMPDFTIVDASDEYLRATLVWREEIRGRDMFEVFPDNPDDPSADGVRNLRESLQRVVDEGVSDEMPVQRYDVRDYVAGRGEWVERFWIPVNSPVFAPGTKEITHLIHHVEDVTQAIAIQQWVIEESEINAEQLAALELIRRDLLRSQTELETVRSQLHDVLQSPQSSQFHLRNLERRFGSHESRRYWSPDQDAPVSGVYEIHHQGGCEPKPSRIFLRAGTQFPRCAQCKEGVFYRLIAKMS